MTTQQREILRVWLAQACGVGPDQVTDEHVERWKALNDEIRAYIPTYEQAASARARARSLGVHPRDGVQRSQTSSDRRAAELLRKTSPTPEEIAWLIGEGYGLEDMSGGGVRPSSKGARVMREAAGL